MFKRRLLTLSSLVIVTILAVLLLPLVAMVTLLLSTSPKYRTAPQALTFIYGFLLFEWGGLTRFAWVLARYPRQEQMEQNRAI
ncbi:MAG TPA: hypothetical protein DE147_11045, partial [Gammaproteobacteria bacterium]|nr:hypothetical protein [Gammaproteobacteria bacterium]